MSFVFKRLYSGVEQAKDKVDKELQENVGDVFAGENIHLGGLYDKEVLQSLSVEDYKKIVEDRAEHVIWTYVLVFPSKGTEKQSGVLGFLKSKVTKNYGVTDDELTVKREKILTALRHASFHIRCFYNTDNTKIICKVGATEERFLSVAESNEYNLRLSEKSVKQVLEAGDVLPSGERRLPIYLDYPYKEKELKEKLLPNFWSIGALGHSRVGMKTIASKLKEQTRLSPFAKLHVRYNAKAEQRIIEDHKVEIYKKYGRSILRTYDRIKLTQMSIESPKVAIKGNRGAGLDLQKLQYDGTILAAYPVGFSETVAENEELTVDQLYDKWSTTFHKPWSQPIDDIREYAGEKIALYFAFLGFYTLWLIPAAIVGLGVFAHQLYELQTATGSYNFVTGNTGIKVINNTINGEPLIIPLRPTEVPELPYYSIFIACWGTFLLEFWKRAQSSLSLNWGTSHYERTAVVRPEFTPTYVLPNVVTGLPELYRSPVIFGFKLAASFATVVTFVGAVIAAIFGTLVFKETVSELGLPETIAPQIALVVNAVLIIILGQIFKAVAKFLTDWENHRTDVEYEDSLIAKTFLFSFFNSYSTLMYYAFIKSGTKLIPDGRTQFCIAAIQELAEDETSTFSEAELAEADSCYGAVGYSLFILFGVQIFVSNTIEVGLPFLKNQFSAYTNKANQAAKKAQEKMDKMAALAAREPTEEKHEEPMDEQLMRSRLMSPAEQQLFLAEYKTPFDDYLEIALQFGYVTLFVSAFPLAPVFALLGCYVEFKVDSSKICFLSRKPDLSSAQDIGTWLSIFTILSFVSVVVNSGIIFFTVKEPVVTDAPADSPLRVWYFIIFIASVYCFKLVVDYFITDVPQQVKLQLLRQEHIERKVFDLEPDEDNLNLSGEAVDPEASFRDLDDEHYLKNATDVEPFDPLIDFMIDHTRRVMHASGYEGEKLKDLSARIFEKADRNKDQVLSLKELKRMLRSDEYGAPLAQMSKFEIKLLMNAMDIDGDGTISKEEFKLFIIGDAAEDDEV